MAEIWKDISVDIETDSLNPENLWVCVVMDVMSGEFEVYRRPDLTTYPDLQARLSQAERIWGHNFIQFDAPVLRRMCGLDVPHDKIVDTLVLSRLGNYFLDSHSLDAWGERLGTKKIRFNDWSHLSQEMIDYCVQDCRVQCKLAKKFMPMLKLDAYKVAIPVEHEIQRICREMHENGFFFDDTKAKELLSDVLSRMQELEDGFATDFPSKLELWKTLKYQKTKDGTLYAVVLRAQEDSAKWEISEDGEELHCYHYVAFNPGSAIHRIDRLWEAGWNPTDKTKGHLDFDRFEKSYIQKLGEDVAKKKREHFDRYGWKCNETNLATLPSDAPQAAQNLAEWLTLDGRRSSLEEWLGHVNPYDNRIHGEFVGIGAWTGRLAHKKPNQANVASEFHGEPSSAVERVKDRYDGPMRGLWMAQPGTYLVGTDAEGIQLRILAHLMKSQSYVDAIIHGKKEDLTDIHNLNRQALGLEHITRDMAKTFIYAFLLGAGYAKVAEILKCSVAQAKEAVASFTESIDGLKQLKEETIPMCADRGYFYGLDGRKVRVPGQHYVLAGMLQNGESVIMKHATIDWTKKAERLEIPHLLCTWPHDEWQTEVGLTSFSLDVNYKYAEQIGLIQRESIERAGEKLGMFCPLAGSTDIGFNWKETH